jgi:hypothetical protein
MGKSSKQPTHTTQTTTAEYPHELKPFIQDIFGKAKGISDQRSADGYQAYNAPRVSEFTEDQETAFQGVRDVQGASQPYFGAQTNLINRATQGPNAQRTAQYMNPYTQNVIDIQQRELGRQGEQERQKIGASAVGAGGFGGSRQAILEAEQMRNQGMRSDDIQAKGMNQSYNLAQQAMNQADARNLQGAGMYGQMAQQIPAQRMKELGALSGVGSALQQQQQRGLDLGFEQFQDEYNFPMKNLNEYSAILRGFPLQPTQTSNRYQMSPSAPLSSQLLGAGAGLGSAAMMGGMFGAAGGQVEKLQQGGLASMYAPPSNRVRPGKTNYQNATSYYPEENPPGNRFGRWWESLVGPLNEGNVSDAEVNEFFTEQPENFLSPEQLLLQQQEAQKVIDRKELSKYQEFPTQEGDREIEEMTMKMDINVKEAEKSKADLASLIEMNNKTAGIQKTAADERILYKTWGPVLAHASKIMSAPDFGSAVGELFNAGAQGVAGRMKGKADEVTMRAATLKSGIENGVLLATIHKDLTPGAAISGLSVALKSLFEQGAKRDDPNIKFILNALKSYTQGNDEQSSTIKNQIAQLIKPTVPGQLITGDEEIDTITEQFIPKTYLGAEGGIVSLAKGGSPKIRSFDFVEEDGILKAVQTESN